VTVLDTFASDSGGSASPDPPYVPDDVRRPGAASADPAGYDDVRRPGAAPADPAVRSHGEVHVSSRVVGFKKIKFYTNENIGSGELDLPEQQMHTTAYWLTVPKAVVAALPYASDDRRDGVVGLSFAMRQVAQLLLMCDRQDIGISIGSGEQGDEAESTRSTELTRQAAAAITLPEEPRIFIYDNYPGGIGFSAPLFGMHADLLVRTRELIAGCECAHGCPTCVGPIGNTGPLAKLVALRILDLLVSEAVAA
jgi:DEAD/DEAH box helicase domain-containing protein